MSKKCRKIILIILIILFVLCAAVMGATVWLMHENFGRGDYPADRTGTAYNWYIRFEKDYPREAVEFPSGDLMLKGYIYGAENKDKLLVFAHGIGSGHEAYVGTLSWFVDQGWCVFAYDAAGSGDSPGDSTKGLVQSALDLDSALTFAETDARLKDMPKAVMGHSWGGYAAAAVLNFDHDVKASVSISGYAYPLEMLDVGAINSVGRAGAAAFHPFVWLYNKCVFGKYAGLNAVDGINKAAEKNIPVLVIHGESDSFVITDQVGIISKKAQLGANAEYMLITGDYSHHNDFFHSDRCNDAIRDWANGEGNCAGETHEMQTGLYSALHDSDEARALFREQNLPLVTKINDFLNAGVSS